MGQTFHGFEGAAGAYQLKPQDVGTSSMLYVVMPAWSLLFQGVGAITVVGVGEAPDIWICLYCVEDTPPVK